MIAMILTLALYAGIYNAIESPKEPPRAPVAEECPTNQCRYNECRMGGGSPDECYSHVSRVPSSEAGHFGAGAGVAAVCGALIGAQAPAARSAWFCTLSSFFGGLLFEFVQRDGDLGDILATTAGGASVGVLRIAIDL